MADNGIQPRLDHVGLGVADLGRAADWYAAALGYERELTLRVDALDLDIVMLRHPQHGDRLELLHRPGSAPGLRAQDPGEAAPSETFSHVAFDVDGLDAAYEHVIALGARPVMSPRPSPEPGVRMAYVADPEGNLVELLDRTNLVTPTPSSHPPDRLTDHTHQGEHHDRHRDAQGLPLGGLDRRPPERRRQHQQ